MIFIWVNKAKLFKDFLLNFELTGSYIYQEWDTSLLIVVVPYDKSGMDYYEILSQCLEVAQENNIFVERISIKWGKVKYPKPEESI